VAKRLLAVALTIVIAGGCASSPPPPPAASPAPALHGVRRVVVVPAGDSEFTVGQGDAEAERVFADLFKWLPYKRALLALAYAVYRGVTSLLDERGAGTAPKGITPGAVVGAAFAQRLRLGGPFEEIVALNREPMGEARQDTGTIVRLAVPSWGLVRVRGGQPELVAAFADVRAQIVVRETGVVLWEHQEDVTHPDRLSLEAVTRDPALARETLVEVLERAGRRVASELVYATRAGR
jgi:hypothetical protein